MTAKVNKPKVQQSAGLSLSVENVVYVLLSIALVSHALDMYRHFTWFYGVSITAGLIAGAALFWPRQKPLSKYFLAGHILFHTGLIAASAPEWTNHEVLLLLIYGWVAALSLKNRKIDLLATLTPYLPVLLFWMYGWAVFHKLNVDFFFADFSCSQVMIQRLFALTPREPWNLVGAWLILLVELMLAVTVLFQRTRGTFIILAFVFHSILLFADFAPFTANMYPLLLLLLPPPVLQKWLDQTAARDLKIYAGTTGLGLLCFELLNTWIPVNIALYFRQVPFLIGAVPSLVSLLMIYRRQKEKRAAIQLKHSLILHFLLAAWGVQTYVGLRTTGTFNMYSNLMTESKTSNHLIMTSQFAKLFPYQHDLVRPWFSRPPKHWKLQRLNGAWVPRVTLYNLAESLKNIEGPLAARIETAQGSFQTANLAQEQNPLWLPQGYQMNFFTGKFLEMRPTRTQRCEW